LAEPVRGEKLESERGSLLGSEPAYQQRPWLELLLSASRHRFKHSNTTTTYVQLPIKRIRYCVAGTFTHVVLSQGYDTGQLLGAGSPANRAAIQSN